VLDGTVSVSHPARWAVHPPSDRCPGFPGSGRRPDAPAHRDDGACAPEGDAPAGAAAVAALFASVTASTSAGASALSGPVARTLTTNSGTHLRPGVTPKVHNGPLSHAATVAPHLTYYGGPVVSDLKSVYVISGTGSCAPYVGGYVAQFTAQYLGPGVMDWLRLYNTPSSGGTGQTIGRGTYAGTFAGTYSGTNSTNPAAGNTGVLIQDTQVQAELAAQITAGQLPATDADTGCALFIPQGSRSAWVDPARAWPVGSAPTTGP